MSPKSVTMTYLGYFFVICFLISWTSCRGKSANTTPTSGQLMLACDDAVSCVIEAQKNDFERDYPSAQLTLKLVSAQDAAVALLNHDVEYIVISRELDSNESDFLIRHQIQVFTQKVALDGLAMIVHADNPIEQLDLGQLEKILSGKIMTWNEIADTLSFPVNVRKIQIVCDGFKSGYFSFLKRAVLNESLIPNTAVFLGSDSLTSASIKILDYISEHENAIGWVSTAWLGENPEYTKRSERLKTLKLANTDYDRAVLPIQGYIYRGDYPLRRAVYVIHRQEYIGLASGFTAFLCGNKGQKKFLEWNLVPAVNPVRLKYE